MPVESNSSDILENGQHQTDFFHVLFLDKYPFVRVLINTLSKQLNITHMKLYAVKPFFMNMEVLSCNSTKSRLPHAHFSGRLTKFSEHWFANIISSELKNNIKILRKFS